MGVSGGSFTGSITVIIGSTIPVAISSSVFDEDKSDVSVLLLVLSPTTQSALTSSSDVITVTFNAESPHGGGGGTDLLFLSRANRTITKVHGNLFTGNFVLRIWRGTDLLLLSGADRTITCPWKPFHQQLCFENMEGY